MDLENQGSVLIKLSFLQGCLCELGDRITLLQPVANLVSLHHRSSGGVGLLVSAELWSKNTNAEPEPQLWPQGSNSGLLMTLSTEVTSPFLSCFLYLHSRIEQGSH